jgi:dienelactone hydrolase
MSPPPRTLKTTRLLSSRFSHRIQNRIDEKKERKWLISPVVGYYTVILDLFNGDAISLNRPESFDFMGWMAKGSDGKNPHTVEHIDKITASGIEFLKSKGYKKIGAVGYCFGAKYVARFMAGKGIDVGYCAHPVCTSHCFTSHLSISPPSCLPEILWPTSTF